MTEVQVPASRRSIQEFWIDFLLEEEFRSEPAFARAFASACGLPELDATALTVDHSFGDEFGEADIIVRGPLEAVVGRGALLIENKINAGFQPDQALRYRRRGEAGVTAELWQTYRTVLVAPQAYIRPGHGFDAAVAYEQLREWVCPTDPLRRAFKSARIQQAIDKKNTTGVKVVDPTMTAFRAWYADTMIAEGVVGHGFKPPPPRPAWRDDNWLEWQSERLPSRCKFRHMTRTGIVDLTFNAVPIATFNPVADLIPSQWALAAIGRNKQHTAIQHRVTPITDFADLEAASPIVRTALSAALEMQALMLAHPALLNLARDQE